MVGCLSTSHTDGTEGSLQSLRSLLATKQAPIPSPSMAKKVMERKLGLGTRKTLQARTSLLDTACHSLAKAKQRTLSFYITSDTTLFPLPLPPGYTPSTSCRLITAKSSSSSTKSSSISTNSALTTKPTPTNANSITKSSSIPAINKRINGKTHTKSTTISNNSISIESTSIPANNKRINGKTHTKSTTISTNSISIESSPILTINKKINVHNTKSSSSSTSSSSRIDVVSTSSSFSSNFSNSPCHSSSNSTTTGHSSCEDLTPFSSTSSSVFSAAPSSFSQSSSFSSSSTNYSDLQCNSLAHENENSFLSPLPPPSPHKLQTLAGSPLREFSPLELANTCENFDDSYKLRDGAMGPFYKVFLPEENSMVAIVRVATKFSRRKWKAQIQSLARLVHPNLSKVMGFSYERAKYTMNGVEGMNVSNTGFIVYESFGNESLEEFLQDVEKGHSHIDWLTRLNIAIGIAEGLSFLLDKMPNHINYGGLTMDNVRVDLSFNAKLLDFDLSSSIDKPKESRSCDVVQSFGNLLLQLFDFISYPQDGKPQHLETLSRMGRAYPPKDAKLVIDLAASCLLTEASLRPSIRHATHLLHSIEPTQKVAKSIKRPKSFANRRKRSLSFG